MILAHTKDVNTYTQRTLEWSASNVRAPTKPTPVLQDDQSRRISKMEAFVEGDIVGAEETTNGSEQHRRRIIIIASIVTAYGKYQQVTRKATLFALIQVGFVSSPCLP